MVVVVVEVVAATSARRSDVGAEVVMSAVVMAVAVAVAVAAAVVDWQWRWRWWIGSGGWRKLGGSFVVDCGGDGGSGSGGWRW